MKKILLPERTLLLWRIRLCAAVGFAFLAAAAFFRFSVYFAAAAGILLAAFLYLYAFYLPRLYKSVRITMSENEISIKKGVFIETERIMQLPLIISVRQTRTPLERWLSLCRVVLSAPGVTLSLGILSEKDAKEIALLGGDKS